MNSRYKKLFSIMIAPILVLYFAFVPIAIFAQGLDDIIREPEVIGDFDIFNPESGRYLKESEIAKPNEQVPGKQPNPQGSGDKPCGWLDIPCTALKILNGVVDFVLWLPLTISGYLLDWMLVTNLNGAMYDSGFVRAGWSISRDVANMFFIFIVLWMALATIFQFESYSAKRLLPKLIIVALLVNFSLPIGLFVINTTNAIAKVFYDTAIEGGSLSEKMLIISELQETSRAIERQKVVEADESGTGGSPAGGVACDQKFKELQSVGIWKRLVHGFGFAQADIDTATTAYNDCVIGSMKTGLKKHEDSTFAFKLASIFWKLIIGLVASFVFFAGAIFLLVRYLSLVILLIFGPLAFLFMILPATQEHWNKWWNKLTQWSFFAPVFLFMIMLSIRVSGSILPFQVASDTSNAPIPSLALQYFLAMGLFIASLMVANSMGIAMSGTVVGWGRRMAFGAGRYARGKGIQKAKILVGGVAGGIQSNAMSQRTLSAIPLMGGIIARGLGRTRAEGEAAEKQRQRQKFGFVEKLSDEARANYIASEKASISRDLLEKMDQGDRVRTINALSASAQIMLGEKLKSVRADRLVGEATNNPEVYMRLTNPDAKNLTGDAYIKAVAETAQKFKPEQISAEFLGTNAGGAYLKTTTKDRISKIAQGTRQQREALGDALADIQKNMYEETEDYINNLRTPITPETHRDIMQNIRDKYFTRDAQEYLATAPGIFEGRGIIRPQSTRGGRTENIKDMEKLLRKFGLKEEG
jgi:hypothetical protein